MYVGDPWYDAAGVQLRNIKYNDESFVTPPVQLSPIRNALEERHIFSQHYVVYYNVTIPVIRPLQ